MMIEVSNAIGERLKKRIYDISDIRYAIEKVIMPGNMVNNEKGLQVIVSGRETTSGWHSETIVRFDLEQVDFFTLPLYTLQKDYEYSSRTAYTNIHEAVKKLVFFTEIAFIDYLKENFIAVETFPEISKEDYTQFYLCKHFVNNLDMPDDQFKALSHEQMYELIKKAEIEKAALKLRAWTP